MKTIGIIGLGIIGSACKFGFEKLGHTVICHDIILDTKIEDILETEIVYICVPTPSNDDGSCDVSIVKQVINDLISINYKGLIVIKSTITPGTTEEIIKNTGYNDICFVPEFLRERCALTDFTENHSLLAIGTNNYKNSKLIEECHGNYPKNVVILSPTEAELLKYYSNTFNAMKIIFANEMYELCEALNINYSNVKNAFIKRDIKADSYLDVNKNLRGYGGVCLPKDTKAIDNLIKTLGLDLKLFETIDEENNKFIKTVFKGMRL